MTDTDDIDTIAKLTVPMFRDGAGRCMIRLADVPLDLLEAFRAFWRGEGEQQDDGPPCAPALEWEAFLTRERVRRHRLMWKRSLNLGFAGPTETDLATAPILSGCVAVLDRLFGGAVLIGTPQGHPICKGPLSNTSRLCGIDPMGLWARTTTRWYKLEGRISLAELDAVYPGGLPSWASCELSIGQVMGIVEDDRNRLQER